MERNLRIMKWVAGTSLPFMLGPILHSFYRFYGMDVSFFYYILAISVVSIFLFEVPTGVIADKIGYKKSMIIAVSLLTTSILMFILVQNKLWFIISEIVFALGIAFKSGADTGLIYDTLVVLDKEDEYLDVYTQIRKFLFVFAGIGSVLSSILFSIDPLLPILINVIFMGSNIVLCFFLEEPIHTKEVERIKFVDQINYVAKNCIKNIDLMKIFIVSSILYSFYRLSFNTYQPFFLATNLDIRLYGLVFAILNVFAFYFSNHAKKIVELINHRYFEFLFGCLLIGFGLLSIPILYLGVFGMVSQQFFRALYGPISTKVVNEVTESNVRATTLSAMSFMNNIFAGTLAFTIGLYTDYINNYQNTFIIFITLFVILVFNIITSKKSKS